MLELDAQGNIVHAGIKDQPIYNPALLLGFPPALLAGVNLACVLPLNGKPHLEALFQEGLIGMPVAAAKVGAGGKPKGALARSTSRRKAVGPLQTVRVHHATDGAELELQLQAVVKQDVGAGCSVFVLIHAVAPQ